MAGLFSLPCMKSSTAAVLIAAVHVVLTCSAASSQQTDINALLDLRNNITNWPEYAAGNNVSGWDSATPVCLWTGIGCNDQGRVSSLSLACNGCAVKVVGTLPSTLGALDVLTSLDLQNNEFHGNLPVEWAGRGQFPLLQNLFLNTNNLTGIIPWQGPIFPQLLLLRVDGNQLYGQLPTNLSMPQLQILRAYNNDFTSGLDLQLLIAFPQLQILSVQNNQLQGGLPSEWAVGNATQNLLEVYVQGNNLTGGLPNNWGNPGAFPVLRNAVLSSNPLGSGLPESWGQAGSFPRLHTLQISNASLSGELPQSWAAYPAFPVIDSIDISLNNLSGPVDNWAGFRSLSRLIIKPGNPGLCANNLNDLNVTLCTSSDLSCLNSVPQLTNCSNGQAIATPAGGGAVASEIPAPPAASPSPSNTGGGVSAVAIVVPLAVGIPLVIAAATLFFLWGKRRRKAAEEIAARKRQEAGAHPFDTYEAQSILTSPFAPAAFRSVNAAAITPNPIGHGSASTTQNVSSDSRESIASACTRIRTRSLELGKESREGDRRGADAAGGDLEMQSFELATAAALTSPARLGGSSKGVSSEEARQLQRGQVLTGSQGLDTPFSDWEIRPEELQIMHRPDGSEWKLGSGGFGTVYKALRNGVQPVAVKKLTSAEEGRNVHGDDFRREISILKSCRDTNIVQFQGAYLSPEQTLLVTEYMEGGNLMENLARGRVTWWRRGRKIAIDIAKGLVFLHSRRIVHFDLKSPNILLARDGTAKIADVGMAKILARNYVTGVVGTLAWAAPEMLWGERCTEKADIYSFGIVLWEICTGERPVRGQLRDVAVPEECPAEVRALMLQCLETRPSRRPTAYEIVDRLRQTAVDSPPGLVVSTQGLAREPPDTATSQEHTEPLHGSAASAPAVVLGSFPEDGEALEDDGSFTPTTV